MMYKTHADAGSMYNTPNCWAIYVCGKVFKYLKSLGGLTAMQRINEEKAKVMYDFLDSSKMFRGAVDPEFRSLMNIPFVTGDKDLDAESLPTPRQPDLRTSRAISPSAACVPQPTTPCRRKAWRPSWNA